MTRRQLQAGGQAGWRPEAAAAQLIVTEPRARFDSAHGLRPRFQGLRADSDNSVRVAATVGGWTDDGNAMNQVIDLGHTPLNPGHDPGAGLLALPARA